MSMSDPLGDMLTRIRNGQLRKNERVRLPPSKLHRNVLEVLRREGYIAGWKEVPHRQAGRLGELEAELKYHEGAPVIRSISRISRPGRRVYAGVSELPRVAGGLGISIVSTPQGVLADHEAREARVGGEVLCTVF
ncbi:MAG: 30S ribosomal protein S8 [Alphaproteobacteria bacterium]